MGRVAVAAFVVLFAQAALAQTIAPVTVTIHAYSFVKSPQDLVPKCGTDPAIRGCTRFFGRKLTGTCAPSEDMWTIEAYAQFGMFTFVWDRKIIGHEMAHIAEIRFDVEDYVESVRAMRFESIDTCTGTLRDAERGFPDVMNALQWKSNSKRHIFAQLPLALSGDGVQ